MSELDDAPISALHEGTSLAPVYPMPVRSNLGRADEFLDRAELETEHFPVSRETRRILEAILFACDRPVTAEQLLCVVPEMAAEDLESALRELGRDYEETGRGFVLQESAGGFLLRTHPDLHEYVTRFLVGKKRSRLSRAAMETLAIVAYRQPLTRGEMEQIRGVDCGQVLHTLLERNLVTIRGRSQALGRPLLYGTTDEFLHYFGIDSLRDLPTPEELQSLLGEDPLEDPEIRGALERHGMIQEIGPAETADEAAESGPGDTGEDIAVEADNATGPVASW